MAVRPHRPERVAVLACDHVVPFNLAVPGQVFAGPTPLELGLYDVVVCGGERTVTTSDGYDLRLEHGLEALDDADLVVVPGTSVVPGEVPGRVAAALRAAHERGARLASLCTGSFVLADTGLLQGRRVTTHWMHAAALREQCPRCDVLPDVLFVDDGSILSSAGLAAGIDLCLHIVAATHGTEVANRCARWLVAAPHRAGGQAQYIERPVPTDGESPLGAVRAWMITHVDRTMTVDELAARVSMSRRTFTRQFRAETGQSPWSWLLDRRLEHARRLLETTDETMHRVAARSGLGTDATLRDHFRRTLGVTPTEYRRTFG